MKRTIKLGVIEFHSESANPGFVKRFFEVIKDLQDSASIADVWLMDLAWVLKEFGYEMKITTQKPVPWKTTGGNMSNEKRIYTRPYVVICGDGRRTIVRLVSPVADSATIGPFKTTRAAEFVRDNPNFAGTVTDAERAAVQDAYNKSMTVGSGS